MSLIRFQPRSVTTLTPARDLDTFAAEVDRIFDRAFRSDFAVRPSVPAMDLVELKDRYQVKVDLPGLSKDDIQISMHDGVLAISGEKKGEKQETEGNLVHHERWSGKFSRSLKLAKDVDANQIEATFENGVLEVSLPFVPEAQPKKIEVRVK